MKLSTCIVAALLGFGGLVYARPQRERREETGDLTPLDELNSLTGSDAFPLSGNDNLADKNVPHNGQDATNDGNAVDTNVNDQTGSWTDQSFSIASSENPMGIPPEDWEKDKRLLQRVKSGLASYVIYKLDTTRKPASIVILKITDESPSLRSGAFTSDLKRFNHGYAVLYTPTKVIPVFFALALTEANANFHQTLFETFSAFNGYLGLDSNMEQIYSIEQMNDFLKEVEAEWYHG